MLTQTQELILELLLSNQEEHFSIRRISRLLGKSYALTYNNIQDLVSKHILQKSSLPPAQIIFISNNIPSSFLLPVEQKRAQKLLEKYSTFRTNIKTLYTREKKYSYCRYAKLSGHDKKSKNI